MAKRKKKPCPKGCMKKSACGCKGKRKSKTKKTAYQRCKSSYQKKQIKMGVPTKTAMAQAAASCASKKKGKKSNPLINMTYPTYFE